MIAFQDVVVGTGGGVACVRCAAAAPGIYDPADVVALRIADATAADGAGLSVALTGPDAFGHPELPFIVAAAVTAGAVRVRLDTDAAALASPRNAAGCLHAGVRQLRVTLLGGTPGVHDALADRPGALDATLDGLASWSDAAEREGARVHVLVRVPVCRHSVRDLPATVAAAARAGAGAVTLEVADPGLDLRAAIPLVAAALDTGLVNGVWTDVAGVPFCLMPERELHVRDVLEAREGVYGPACGDCALRGWCGGLPAGSGPSRLALASRPANAAALAAGVERARGEVRGRG